MNEKLEEYRVCAISFFNAYAELVKVKKQIEKEEFISIENLHTALDKTAFFKKKFLQSKENLNLHTKLQVLDNAAFKGFEIKDGELVGDTSNVASIAKQWLYSCLNSNDEAFFTDANCYKFELAVLLISLAG